MKKNQLLYVVIIQLCFLLSACSQGSVPTQANNIPQSNPQNVMILTDIHFDPFSSCGDSSTKAAKDCVQSLINQSDPTKWSFSNQDINSYGVDPNNEFFIKGITGLDAVIKNNNIHAVFLLGDMLSHDFARDFHQYVENGTQEQLTNLSLNTMRYVLYNLSKHINGANIYYVLGNNDTDTSDYSLPTTKFLQQAAKIIAPYTVNPTAATATFENGGYSAQDLGSKIEVIGVNGNVLSIINKNNVNDLAIANQQFIWLQGELQLAKQQGKKVILLQHEPFGINTYYAQLDKAFDEKDYLVTNPVLQQKYLDLYQKYHDEILNIYSGHFHMEYISVNSGTLNIGTIGFSVVFGNNPGFKIIQLDNSGKLLDYTTYYANLANKNLNWNKLYSFNQAYNITPGNYVNFFQNEFPSIDTDPIAISYSHYYDAGRGKQPITKPEKWPYYYCTITHLELLAYQSCLKGF